MLKHIHLDYHAKLIEDSVHRVIKAQKVHPTTPHHWWGGGVANWGGGFCSAAKRRDRVIKTLKVTPTSTHDHGGGSVKRGRWFWSVAKLIENTVHRVILMYTPRATHLKGGVVPLVTIYSCSMIKSSKTDIKCLLQIHVPLSIDKTLL